MGPAKDPERGVTWLPDREQETRFKRSVVTLTICGLILICATSTLIKGSETEMIGHQTTHGVAVARPESCEYTISAQNFSAKGENGGTCFTLAVHNATSCARLTLAAPKAHTIGCARLALAAHKATTDTDGENALGDNTDIDGDSYFNSVGHLSPLRYGFIGAGYWPDDPMLDSHSSDASPASDAILASHRLNFWAEPTRAWAVQHLLEEVNGTDVPDVRFTSRRPKFRAAHHWPGLVVPEVDCWSSLGFECISCNVLEFEARPADISCNVLVSFDNVSNSMGKIFIEHVKAAKVFGYGASFCSGRFSPDQSAALGTLHAAHELSVDARCEGHGTGLFEDHLVLKFLLRLAISLVPLSFICFYVLFWLRFWHRPVLATFFLHHR
jgi:hypothetical protein